LEEIPLNVEENAGDNDLSEIPAEEQIKEDETSKANDSSMDSPKKGVNNQSSSSSIIDSVKNRPRSKRKVDGEDIGYSSPPSSIQSRSKSEELKQLSPPPTTTTPPQAINGESPKVPNGSPVRNSIVIPSNTVNPSVIENPNRRTLLRISTAGSVQSGDTHGTYLGVEQSKFVMIVSMISITTTRSNFDKEN